MEQDIQGLRNVNFAMIMLDASGSSWYLEWRNKIFLKPFFAHRKTICGEV